MKNISNMKLEVTRDLQAMIVKWTHIAMLQKLAITNKRKMAKSQNPYDQIQLMGKMNLQ